MYFMYLQLTCKIRVFMYSATVTCRIVVCKSSHLLVITNFDFGRQAFEPTDMPFVGSDN